MNKWKIDYKYNTYNRGFTVIEAATYTMALLEFVVRFPTYEYISVELVGDKQRTEMI